MMKQTLRNKKNRKIIALTGMAIFSLLTVFVATWAWFALNSGVSGSGMAINVEADGDGFTSLTVHRCIINESTDTSYKFDPTPAISFNSDGHATSSDDVFRVDDYSSLNTSQPVLLLLHLATGTESKDVSITGFTNIIYSAYANAGAPDGHFQVDAQTVKKYPFSLASKFKSGQFTDDTFNFTVSISSLPTASQFVQVTNSAITGLSTDITMFQGTGSTQIRYVAIVMDYEETAIQFLISQNMNNTYVASNNNKIDYYCDWTMNITATIETQP